MLSCVSNKWQIRDIFTCFFSLGMNSVALSPAVAVTVQYIFSSRRGGPLVTLMGQFYSSTDKLSLFILLRPKSGNEKRHWRNLTSRMLRTRLFPLPFSLKWQCMFIFLKLIIKMPHRKWCHNCISCDSYSQHYITSSIGKPPSNASF